MLSDTYETSYLLNSFQAIEEAGMLNSDKHPCTSEQSSLEDLIERAEQEVIRHDKDVATYGERIKRLQRESAKLDEFIARAKHSVAARQSPAGTLLPEILTQIFEHVVTGSWNIVDDEVCPEEWRLPAKTLGLVCSNWRYVADSSPALWSKISLSVNCDIDTEEISEAENLEWSAIARPIAFLLTHSKEHLLDIRICAKWTPYDVPHPAMKLLFSESHRWRSLDIDVDSFGLALGVDFESSFPYKFPQLERATFLLHNPDVVESILESPRLRYVRPRIGGESYDDSLWFCPTMEFNRARKFPQIAEVVHEIAGFDIHLHMYPNVQVVTLSSELDREFLEQDLEDAEQGRLLPDSCHSLIIEFSLEKDADMILEFDLHFSAPKITNLRLRTCGDQHLSWLGPPPKFPVKPLRRFLRKSKCKLSSFALENCCNLQVNIKQLVSVLPVTNPNTEVYYKDQYSRKIVDKVVVVGSKEQSS